MIITCNFSFAQVKFEREYDISQDEVPAQALAFTGSFFPDLKLKWFGEESQDGKSIEAKSFKRKQKYSIEFSTEGELLDIEKGIKFNSIAGETRAAINELLRRDFDKFKIAKVQIQWSGELSAVKSFLKNSKETTGLQTAYEIELEGKKDGNSAMYEFLFSDTGQLLSKKEIETRTTVNLEF